MALTPLIPLQTARQQLLASLPRLAKVETLPVAQALGRVLAADLFASIDVPPRANSAMDGYAVRRAEASEGAELVVSQRVPAGTAPLPLTPGTAARIFTGAQIPPGADAVVMQENTERLDNDRVRILQMPSVAESIRQAGSDLPAGAAILAAGQRLSAAALGVCASAGVSQLSVYRPLRVALVCTGDELVEPGLPLQEGQIYNSNRPLVTSLLRQAGFDVIDLPTAVDTREATRAALLQAVELADAVITTGGVSVGEEDHVKAVIAELGRINLWRIRIRPGKPFAAGEINATPIFGLPGNPTSALVTFALLARPCLMHLQGAAYTEPLSIPIAAGFSRKVPESRDEYMRVALENGVAQRLSSQSSGVLSSALTADGLLHLPANEEIVAGQPYAFIPFCALLNS